MTDQPEAADLAAETLGRDLLDAIIRELEAAPGGWTQLPEISQHQSLERLRVVVRNLIDTTMRVMLGQDFPACPATLEGISIKGAINARLTIAKGALSRHELLDAVGTSVIVLVGDHGRFLEGFKDRKAKSQQLSLLEQSEGPGSDAMPDLESDLPEDEPEPEPELTPEQIADADETLWVETARDRDKEQNVTTGHTRMSRRAAVNLLLDKLTTWNAEAKNPSIRFDETTVLASTRQELLMALGWLDAYISDQATEIAAPAFLIPENRAP